MPNFLRVRRRRRLLATPMPAGCESCLTSHVRLFDVLTPDERRRLCDLTRVFIDEKTFEGAHDMEVTGFMKTVIASQACLLLLGHATDPARAHVFPNLSTVIVYAGAYVAHEARMGPGGLIQELGLPVLGQAHFNGPIILSWNDALEGGHIADDGRNVVLHEFAHKLDMLGGVMNGTPPLPAGCLRASWVEVMTSEFERLRADARTGRATVLNTYGATNPAEFFAVATECFFERGVALRDQHPELYALLRCYYAQDPASRRAAKPG